METKKATSEVPKDRTSLILRLERVNKDISTLRSTMSSYICEPKTPSLFEQKETIKNRMEGIKGSNQKIIGKLRNRKREFDGQMDKVVHQLKEFRDLERNVLEYIGKVKMHC